jgi:hypothetical protein
MAHDYSFTKMGAFGMCMFHGGKLASEIRHKKGANQKGRRGHEMRQESSNLDQ